MTTSSTMKCCDGNCVRRWPLTSFGSYRPGPYLHKGKSVCVRDVCAIYDNNISPSLLMIIIKIIILYFIKIRNTDDFPPTGTLLVIIICHIDLIPAPNDIMFQIHTLALLDDKRDNVTL